MKAFCPNCEALIRSKKVFPEGHRINCPNCQTPLAVSEHAGQTVLVKVKAKPPTPPKPPKPRRPVEDDFDDNEGAPRPKRRKKKQEQKNNLPLILGVGGAAAILAVVAVVGVVLVMDDSGDPPPPQQYAQDDRPAPPQPPPFAPAEAPPGGNGPPTDDPPIPLRPAFADFRLPMKMPADGIRPLKDIPDDQPLPQLKGKSRSRGASGPKFPALLLPTEVAEEDPDKPSAVLPFFPPLEDKPKTVEATDEPLNIDQIKKAVTYIKVKAGPFEATGSGFLIYRRDNFGLVATNFHVIDPTVEEEIAPGVTLVMRFRDKLQIEVVFDSGQPTEWSAVGEIVATDPVEDLAVLKVIARDKPFPEPINPLVRPAVTETDDVLICGFPFGDDLAAGSRNPSITINKGAVSSLRRDDSGGLARVQIDGNLNPGNSGGPVVNTKGHLVGVAVESILGSGIGLAVPTNKLVEVMFGRAVAPLLIMTGVRGNLAQVEVIVLLADPFDRLRGVALYHDRGDPPTGLPDYKRTRSGTPVPLEIDGFAATTTLYLPMDDPKTPHLLQFGSKDQAGRVVFSRVLAYRIDPNAEQAVPDSFRSGSVVSLSEVDANPDYFEDKSFRTQVVLDGELVKRDGEYGLKFRGDVGPPKNLRVTIDRKAAVLYHSLGLGRSNLLAGLHCTVEGADSASGGGPRHVLKVEKIDLLTPDGEVAYTVPSYTDPMTRFLVEAPRDHPAGTRINRAELLMNGELEPQADGSALARLCHPSGADPLGVRFRVPPEVVQGMKQVRMPRGYYHVHATMVMRRQPAAGQPTVLDVEKLEFLDPGGKRVVAAVGG